jgi:hypothetical protein
MKKDYTHIVILLDKSGSMGHLQKDVVGGVNTLLAEQRKLPGKATVTLAQFDNGPYYEQSALRSPWAPIPINDSYEVNYNFVDINFVKDLTTADYKPRGSTALRDSFAKLIDDTGANLAKMNESDRPERVIFVVQTDGEENSSLRVTIEELRQKVTTQTNQFNWQFIFMGANIDSFSTAHSYGIASANTTNFTASSAGVEGSYMATSNLMSCKRSVSYNAMDSVGYTDEDRKMAAGETPIITNQP